ncbi:DUF4249 domain-containing protein [Aquiflexum lacus]|uniref:DUF4249 domain-containing protein n=1 Tax=Aquiflexum lacus TaxID=2483805 RepID=UPI001893CD93|nr:DUF4249 domain-containing protein [Aquiflexum lacus]
MKSKNSIVLIILFNSAILISSCIDRFEFTADEPERILNVEGFISTVPKAHQVRLSRVEKFGPDFIGRARPEELATVMIKDDLGSVISLTEGESGNYYTAQDFAAELGRSYSLEVFLKDGRRFFSLPEKVMPVPNVDSVTYHSVRTTTADRFNDEIGIAITAHFQDPADQENYYYWKQLPSTFVVVSEPENYLTPGFWDPPKHPWPLDCCSRCFDVDIPSPLNVYSASDFDFNGTYQSRTIGYLRDDGLKFKETYRLDILHLSVSEACQRFLKLVDQQVRLTGSIFDPPPANIRGNILNLNDPTEQVMGYFFASDEQLLRTYIHKENLEFFLTPITLLPIDCRNKYFEQYPNPFRPNPDPLPITPPIDWDPVR